MATRALLNRWLWHLIQLLTEMQNAIFLQRTLYLLRMDFWSEGFLVTEMLLLTRVDAKMCGLAVPQVQPVQFGGQQLEGNIASCRSKQNEKGNNIQKEAAPIRTRTEPSLPAGAVLTNSNVTNPVSTYMLYMYGKQLLDKAFRWEYTKLATCKLLSFIATFAMAVIKGRAGLVSKIAAQAIIRASGGSDWSARIWMRYPCTCREKTASGITNNWDFFTDGIHA